MKTSGLCVYILLITALSVAAQNAPAPSSKSVSDPIQGVWRLNVDKSKNGAAVPESEVLTITQQNDSYKLTFDIEQANGYNPKYDVVTRMNGESVQPINADGQRLNDSWRVTRRGANKFDMELVGGWTDKYEVSQNGKTMTLHRVLDNSRIVGGRIDRNGVLQPQPEYILVFERVK